MVEKPKISVLFPTIRHGSIPLLLNFLSYQTFQDFECLILDELYPLRKDVVKGIIKERSLVEKVRHLRPPEKSEETFWNLCKSCNMGLKESRGKLIVVIQDFFYFPKQTLQRLWDHYKINLWACISAVSHRLWDDGILKDVRIKGDNITRTAYKNLIKISPIEFEMNLASIPRQGLIEIGGWDENFDLGWHYENPDIAVRLNKEGYELYLDTELVIWGVWHPRSPERKKYGKINLRYLESKWGG